MTIACPNFLSAMFVESVLTYLLTNYLCNTQVLRECVRNLDLRVQVHPGELWVSKQRVHIVLEDSKSAGAKDDVPNMQEKLEKLFF